MGQLSSIRRSPLAARIVAWSTPLGPAGGALLVANLAFAGALFMLYLLSTLEFSEAVARRTVVLLSVYPASFVFLSPFSESLFLLATVATFYLARRRTIAGASAVAGVVATATRVVGVWLDPGPPPRGPPDRSARGAACSHHHVVGPRTGRRRIPGVLVDHSGVTPIDPAPRPRVVGANGPVPSVDARPRGRGRRSGSDALW